ncbi:MAG: ABC transporter transmembrane domain-containing protein, partial [Eggerthellaceae bacterium]|nr:ABC transporter transmembrane domain-containing protein [Eggerthellaceae bacterium]
MRIIQYLKSSKVAVLLITLLLIVQAFADLSLPRYTSDLVDVGIQQGGIEHASPDEMSADTFNYICMLADEDTEQLIRDSYEQNIAGENEASAGEDESNTGENGTRTGESEARNYILSEYGKENRAELDSAIALPLVLVHMSDIMGDASDSDASSGVSGESNNTAYSSSFSEAPSTDSSEASSSSDNVTALAQSAMQSGSFDWAQLYSAYKSGAISKAEIQSFINQARQAYGAIDDSLIQQQAIEAVKAEYEALGMDLGVIQLQYLAWLGAQMLGVAALMMAASISVGFVASRTAAKIARNLRERLFEKVVSFSDAEVQSFSAASLITRGTNDIQQIQMVLVMLLRMVLYAPILAIGGIIMVSQTNLAMSWIIVLAIVVIGIVIALLMALALPKFKI